MERQAREYAEQQLGASQQRQAHLESEIKQERQAAAESSAAAGRMAEQLEQATRTIAAQAAALDAAAAKVCTLGVFCDLSVSRVQHDGVC